MLQGMAPTTIKSHVAVILDVAAVLKGGKSETGVWVMPTHAMRLWMKEAKKLAPMGLVEYSWCPRDRFYTAAPTKRRAR